MIKKWNLPKLKALKLNTALETFNMDWLSGMPDLRDLYMGSCKIKYFGNQADKIEKLFDYLNTKIAQFIKSREYTLT